uniref:Uncharacterized protein n=1 Tax=Gasterosteus aculeatus aculeatus TaxID=481459 RepID=A0AAQ4S5C8_GASAC
MTRGAGRGTRPGATARYTSTHLDPLMRNASFTSTLQCLRQVCYKDLATVTPANIKTIAQNLTAVSWIGLRRNFSDAGSSSASWSRWADGERLLFQNWYPGWPVFQKNVCYCNCPTTATTTRFTPFTQFTSLNAPSSAEFPNMTNSAEFPNATSFAEFPNATGSAEFPNATSFAEFPNATSFAEFPNATGSAEFPTVVGPTMTSFGEPALPGGTECVLSPDPAGNYVEDSCVAMLSFGAWVERSCSERLSFVCYEDRFPGRVEVTEVTSESAVLTWLPVPNISHSRVEVKVHGNVTQNVTNLLTLDLVGLTAGSLHTVQVFPVKCGRDMHPQQTAFYTKPNKVVDLVVADVTEACVKLNWSKPAGNVDIYHVKFGGASIRNKTEGSEVCNLTPGSPYTFFVLSGVEDNSIWSDESNVTTYTRPGKVSHLNVTQNTHSSLLLAWERPAGHTTGFGVTAATDSDRVLFNETVTQEKVNVTSLPPGTKITLNVTALTAGGKLEGETVTVVSYTTPTPVSDLVLRTTSNTLNASWNSANGDTFDVELWLDGELVGPIYSVSTAEKPFVGLKAAANYAVRVSAVTGHLRSLPKEASAFTKLLPPTDARLRSADKHQITFEWSAPENIAKVNYTVRLYSTFWGQDWSHAENETFHTFDGLKSGTNYGFEVRTVANGAESDPAVASNYTVAVKKEISLSMMCSSAQSLLCDKQSTRDSVFNELNTHFRELLGDSVVWKLVKQEN